MAALLGLLLFSLVIPILVTTFMEVYEYADSIPNTASLRVTSGVPKKQDCISCNGKNTDERPRPLHVDDTNHPC